MSEIFHVDFFAKDWLLDTQRLTLEERGVFIQIVAGIYQHQAPIDNDAQWLSNLCNCSVRKVKSILASLSEKKFISIIGDKIIQKRAIEELEKAHKRRENATKNARKSHENSVKTARKSSENEGEFNENNELGSASNQSPDTIKEKNKKEIGCLDDDSEDPIWSTHPPERPDEKKYPSDLLEFCRLYPKPDTRPYRALLTLWNMATMHSNAEELIGAALAYGRTTDDPKFIRSAAKFLEGGFYEQFIEQGREEAAKKQETAAMIDKLEPWQQAVVDEIGLAKWRLWIGAGPIERENDTVTFSVKDKNSVQWCENNLQDDIQRALGKFYKKPITVKFKQGE